MSILPNIDIWVSDFFKLALKVILFTFLISLVLKYSLALLLYLFYHLNLSFSIFFWNFLHDSTIQTVQYSILAIFIWFIIKILLPILKN